MKTRWSAIHIAAERRCAANHPPHQLGIYCTECLHEVLEQVNATKSGRLLQRLLRR